MTLRILVTGATDGIGRETAAQLIARGHDVVVHGRDPHKARAVAEELQRAAPRPLPRPVVADLASLADVAALADDLKARAANGEGLDVVVANAGVYAKRAERTADGHERTVAVNHLAHFSLVLRLLPLLQQAPQGRVVVVSSVAHARGAVDFDAFEHKRIQKRWDPYGSYAESKLMNVLFANELARRLKQAGSAVTANSLHPGVVSTKLLTQGFGMTGPDSHEDGAATSVFLATDPSVATTSGGYYVRSRPAQASHAAEDAEAAARLWSISARHCGVDFA